MKMLKPPFPIVASLTIGCVSLLAGPNAQSAPQNQSSAVVPYRYRTRPMPKSARNHYSLVWGVEDFSVKVVESGEIVRFSYRVLDPDKARMLNDKKNEPSLTDPQAGVRLMAPTLEKVGQLRQSTSPEAGKVYWMAFSNKGRYVKPGHRVNITIGNFHADGLIVQ